MKASSYNYFLDCGDGGGYILNGLSGALLRLDKRAFDLATRLLSQNGDTCDANVVLPAHYHHLVAGRFVVQDGTDEIEVLKLRHRLSRFSGKSRFLTVMVTNDCNFHCEYCYRRPLSGFMTPEARNGLAKYVSSFAGSTQQLRIHWFGGEPLLRWDIITSLTSELQQICHKKGCNYSAQLSTNGSLLRSSMIERLDQLRIDTIRISLHQEDTSSESRGLLDQITRLIPRIADVSRVVVRVNFYKDTLELVKHLLRVLRQRGLQTLIKCELVPVVPLSSASRCAHTCFSPYPCREFIDSFVSLAQAARGMGFALLTPEAGSGRSCVFDDAYSFVVATDGRLYKCLVDDKTHVGTVSGSARDGARLDFVKWSKWAARDPFSNESCRTCGSLPLCMGGCLMKGCALGDDASCSPWKGRESALISAFYADCPES